MTTKRVRQVNVVPFPSIKKERPSDDEDENTVSCKICHKGFVVETALNNHARMEHIEQYLAGEDLCVKVYNKKKRKYTEEEKIEIQKKTDELISSMAPTNIMSLASNDVSYIIIKDGQAEVKQWRKDSPTKSDLLKEKPVRMIKQTTKKEKEVQAITGPFECLQPSNNSAKGLCHQMFLSCCEYSTHYRDEHTRRRKGLRCQVCEKPLSGEAAEPFACQVCGLGFDNSKDLSTHTQNAHIKLKPFQCQICTKRFTQLGGLQQHMRMHSGDRPFTCNYCPKAFTQKSGLDQHLRIHTKDKPYKCVICKKSFCQSVHLQQHMRTHTNVAPFQCGICEKRFKQSSHLNYHLKYHNPGNMTDEQKEKFAELLRIMGRDIKNGQDIEIDASQTIELQPDGQVAETYILPDGNMWGESVEQPCTSE